MSRKVHSYGVGFICPAGGLDFLVLNHVGNSYVEFWNRDPDHVRTLMQVNGVNMSNVSVGLLSNAVIGLSSHHATKTLAIRSVR